MATNVILPIVRIAKRHMSKEAYEAFLVELEEMTEKRETLVNDA